jgi:PAS domain S-box-containing protein
LPWGRLPRAVARAVPFLSLVLIAMLRHAEGGAVSGYGILVIAPVLWFALYGSRRELIGVLCASALVFVIPILAFGEPDYPASEWRRAVLTTALAAMVGLVTQRLVRETRERASEAALLAEESKRREAFLQAVMDSAAEGIVAIGSDGRTTFANPAAAELTGHTLEELDGALMHSLVHHTKPDGSPYPLEECPTLTTLTQSEATVVSDEVYWRADGTSFPVEYRSTPMVQDGETIGVVNTFTDISERTAAERMKNEFISVVSHELRTPLTSIRGSLGLLQGGVLGELSDEAAEMLSIAITNTDRLVRLINDILDVERIESGKAPMELAENDLAGLMAATADIMEPAAKEAGVALNVEPAECRIIADGDRVVQTLVNLVGNAIKFTGEGGTVTVSAEREGDSVRISVADQGPGIPPERQSEIFGRFAQLNSDDSRLRGGSGLGLAIARGIVEQHGGRIWVESSGPQGSVFAVELPIVPGDDGADPGSSYSALIVEDDRDLAAVLVATLERNGERGLVVRDVETAIRAHKAYSPDLIVLDLALPGEDGRRLLEELRAQERLGQSEVVIYTASDLRDDEREDLRDVAEVVTKSRVPADEFERVMLRALERARG